VSRQSPGITAPGNDVTQSWVQQWLQRYRQALKIDSGLSVIAPGKTASWPAAAAIAQQTHEINLQLSAA